MNTPLIILCSGLSTLLPFLAGIVILNYSNRRPKTFLFLWIFFALAVLAETALFALGTQGKQSAWIFHIYTVIEYVLITGVLANWQNQSRITKLMRTSIPIYIFLFILLKVAGLENFETGLYNNITRPFALFLLSAFAFITLQDLWSRTPANLAGDYRFWMLLAMALYYSASLALFSFMFTRDRNLLIALFKIHAVVNIMHNILFTIGVLRLRGGKPAALQPTPAS